MISDKEIMGGTTILPHPDKGVTLRYEIDADHAFEQRAESAESAKKHIIRWCEAVRQYAVQVEKDKQEEALARRKSRGAAGIASDALVHAVANPKAAILQWMEETQAKIDELGLVIENAQAERKQLRDERDKIKPIVDAWKGTTGENHAD